MGQSVVTQMDELPYFNKTENSGQLARLLLLPDDG